MAVIDLPPAADLDPGLHSFAKREADGSLPDEGNELLRFWNAAPEHARALLRHHFELWLGSSLPPRLTELVRLAVANGTRCPVCLAIRNPRAAADGVDELLVAAIPDAESDPQFSEAERAAIDYAGRLAGDHLSISSATYDRLRAIFSDREVAEITMLASSFLGMGRVLETLTADQACPLPAAR
jgi:AhpD family alkylhydroperoxidase